PPAVYTLSLHDVFRSGDDGLDDGMDLVQGHGAQQVLERRTRTDADPLEPRVREQDGEDVGFQLHRRQVADLTDEPAEEQAVDRRDRKSTRLNSSHSQI